MIRSKRSLMIAVTLLVVLALVFAGCGGGGGGSNDGGSGNSSGNGGGGGNGSGGGGLLKPKAENYMGTWKWDGNSEFPSIEFTVGPKNGEWARGSYHQGSIKCEVYQGDSIDITGTYPDHIDGWIELCTDGIYHYIHVERLQKISDTYNVRVSLNGQLIQLQPGVIGVDELTISKGEDYDEYRSIDHNDELLWFYKQ